MESAKGNSYICFSLIQALAVGTSPHTAGSCSAGGRSLSGKAGETLMEATSSPWSS